MPARPTPDEPSSWLMVSDGRLSGSTYGRSNGTQSIRLPPGSITGSPGSSTTRWSTTGVASTAASSRSRTPWAETIAVDGSSAGKIASTRNPSSPVSATRSSLNAVVRTTTWASWTLVSLTSDRLGTPGTGPPIVSTGPVPVVLWFTSTRGRIASRARRRRRAPGTRRPARRRRARRRRVRRSCGPRATPSPRSRASPRPGTRRPTSR